MLRKLADIIVSKNPVQLYVSSSECTFSGQAPLEIPQRYFHGMDGIPHTRY